MYQKGDLKLLDPPCDDEYYEEWEEGGYSGRSCENYDHTHSIRDARMYKQKAACISPCAYLPHSCDEWVIGGVEQIKTLIEDLQGALKQL